MEEQKTYDPEVFLAMALILLAGLMTIYVATQDHLQTLVWKQLTWATVGAECFWLLRNVDYRYYAQHAHYFYGAGILLLLSVFVIGKKVNGAISWIDLGPLNVQPSELTRITTLIMLARLYEWNQGVFLKTEEIGKALLFVLVPTGLVLLQPDLGMALIYLALLGAFFVMSRIPKTVYISVIMTTFIFAVFLYGLYSYSPSLFFQVVRPHQFDRLLSFMDPESDPLGSGYQYIQARKLVGSGQLGGMTNAWALTSSSSKLPEQHTDFIFAVVAQHWGFLGGSILLLLYFFLFFRLIAWAMKTPDLFAAFFISGMVTMWAFQVFVNIGMNIGLSPITGLTLPFISYGGSSLISNLIAFAMIVSMRHPSPSWKLSQLE
ncbi:FtsW/RodA/SpoVE family cell cycle protein [Brevibacillus migulae]|uniref:FtsW/RodA/SpoVE family cell cycle protein n=1 Tax=Brevibacillus migulae TaxID=1644114 RepID=UPI0014317715|nr:FtsW/RodA/SpoVE family cell cycle protein [Brevibacillus migulae]